MLGGLKVQAGLFGGIAGKEKNPNWKNPLSRTRYGKKLSRPDKTPYPTIYLNLNLIFNFSPAIPQWGKPKHNGPVFGMLTLPNFQKALFYRLRCLFVCLENVGTTSLD